MAKTLLKSCTKLPFFQGISAKDLESLLSDCEGISLKRGQALLQKGTPAENAFVVVFGSLKMVEKSGKEERVIEFFGRSRLIGGPLMTPASTAYPLTATALEDSLCIKVSKKTFMERWQNDPILSKVISEQTIGTISALHQAIGSATQTVPQRIVGLFFRLLEGQCYESDRIMVRLTRQDIANAIGSTVESVIRVVSQWTKNDWIETIDQYIEIKNKKALKAILEEN